MKKLFNLVTALVILWAIMYFTGCSLFSPDHFARDQQRAQLFYLQNPGELAKVCALQYPVKAVDTATHIDSTHKAANVNMAPKLDSLALLAGSYKWLLLKNDQTAETSVEKDSVISLLQQHITALARAYRPCVPDTVFDTQTIKVRDVAADDSLKNYVSKLTSGATSSAQQLADAQRTAGNRLWIIIAESVLIVILIIVLICKIF